MFVDDIDMTRIRTDHAQSGNGRLARATGIADSMPARPAP